MNGLRIELLEPMDENSTVSESLKRRGEGFHYICFRVGDLEKVIENLKSMGLRGGWILSR